MICQQPLLRITGDYKRLGKGGQDSNLLVEQNSLTFISPLLGFARLESVHIERFTHAAANAVTESRQPHHLSTAVMLPCEPRPRCRNFQRSQRGTSRVSFSASPLTMAATHELSCRRPFWHIRCGVDGADDYGRSYNHGMLSELLRHRHFIPVVCSRDRPADEEGMIGPGLSIRQ